MGNCLQAYSFPSQAGLDEGIVVVAASVRVMAWADSLVAQALAVKLYVA